MKNNVAKIEKKGLCISCGICVANCPMSCIELKRNGSEVKIFINENLCVNCGVCNKVCPSSEIINFDIKETSIIDFLVGKYISVICASAENYEMRWLATSGGFITQLIYSLLKKKIYDSAFLIGDYVYSDRILTKRYTAQDNLLNTAKSRYLTVSHENSIMYMRNHPNEKIILVGTGCVINGILKSINIQRLKRDNYLLIGLFCDKTMHYGVVDYFASHPVSKTRKMSKLYFRTKESGGWPGNIRIYYTDNSFEDLPNTERMKVKDYFMPERCLYCLDKLNRNCDISVGDNYIPKNYSKAGENSCIIRTNLGKKIWNSICSDFVWHYDNIDELIESQHLNDKINNYYFACLKGLYPNNNNAKDKKKEYKQALSKIALGKKGNAYVYINRDINRNQLLEKLNRIKKSSLKNIIRAICVHKFKLTK